MTKSSSFMSVRIFASLFVVISVVAARATDAPSTRPRQTMPSPSAANSADDAKGATAAQDAPKFVTEAKWLLAGYNNNELVYTVIVTNEDARIIRCITDVKGTYIDNGKKLVISDRQTTTLLPNQPTQVGNWMDLDQDSGATYSVKCHAV